MESGTPDARGSRLDRRMEMGRNLQNMNIRREEPNPGENGLRTRRGCSCQRRGPVGSGRSLSPR